MSVGVRASGGRCPAGRRRCPAGRSAGSGRSGPRDPERPVVRDEVARGDRHQRGRELAGAGRARAPAASRALTCAAPATSSRATTTNMSSRPPVCSSGAGSAELCTQVYHRGSAEKPSYAVPPSMTATVASSPRSTAQRVEPVQRRAQHPPTVGAAAQGAQRAVQPRPHLEGVPPGEPARAEDEGAQQVEQHVGADRDAQHRQGGPVGGDQLEPGEGEQPERGRPVARGPVGEGAVRVEPREAR